jgi:hypothetical protein
MISYRGGWRGTRCRAPKFGTRRARVPPLYFFLALLSEEIGGTPILHAHDHLSGNGPTRRGEAIWPAANPGGLAYEFRANQSDNDAADCTDAENRHIHLGNNRWR